MNPSDVSAAAFEMKGYFLARRICLRADPPCVIRPCETHLELALSTLRSATMLAPSVDNPSPAGRTADGACRVAGRSEERP